MVERYRLTVSRGKFTIFCIFIFKYKYYPIDDKKKYVVKYSWF